MQKRLFLFFLIIMIGVMGVMAGSTFSEEANKPSKHSHAWSGWTSFYDKERPCTTEGRRERFCLTCLLIQKERVPAQGHLGVYGWNKTSTHHSKSCLRYKCTYQIKEPHNWGSGGGLSYCKTCNFYKW